MPTDTSNPDKKHKRIYVRKKRGPKTYEVTDLRNDLSQSANDWMVRLFANSEFQSISAENLQTIFSRLSPRAVRSGEKVIEQGDPGEFFYIVTQGRCEMVRELQRSERIIKLAELVVGDTFGEEALITGTPREATVQMLSDGVVMKLGKEDFIELIAKPLSSYVDLTEAESIVGAGGQWLQVDPDSDDAEEHMMHISAQILRHKIHELDAARHHIVTCSKLSHSCAAAHVLRQHGIKASVLENSGSNLA